MDYKDQNLSIEKRVTDLLARMNLEEKVAQLSRARLGDCISDLESFNFSADMAIENIPHGCGYMGRIGGATDLKPQEMAGLMNEIQHFFLEETRLGIPVIFLTEATSGVLSRNHTLFPQNIGAAAMFDEELVGRMGAVIREEMTATGERMALAPVVDIIRDHRYGRYEESFGEDVYLAAQYGKAYTANLQGEDLTTGVAATLKHFVGQGINMGGRNCGPVKISRREILDEYAVPFAAAIQEADAAAVMAAYHEIDQVPCHASKEILTEILRDKLDFTGLTISDGNGIQLLKDFQEYVPNLKAAVKESLAAGIELELDHIYKDHLKEVIKEGKIKEEVVDSAVNKVLTLKFKLGLFDDPYVDEGAVTTRVAKQEHLETSRQMALETMTLLKNEADILPLDNQVDSLAVVGPLADKKEFAYADYSYPTHFEEMYYESEAKEEEEVLARSLFFSREETSYQDLFHQTKTIYETIKEYTSPQTEVYYAAGLKDTYNYNDDADFYSIEQAVEAADKAEVVVAVCGDTSGLGAENDSGESVDRAEIGLSTEQRELLQALNELKKPVILLLCSGRPLELSYESENMEAILAAWKSGVKGAEAICEVLFGHYNPAGRLPVTIPKCLGQLPVYYSRRPTGKKQFWRDSYLEVDLEPLYEFGFGKSYTSFEYQAVEMSLEENAVKIEAEIANTGDYDGEEVAQVYVRKKYTSLLQPERELKAFDRVFIEQDSKVKLEFEIKLSSLAYHDQEERLVLEDCQLEIMLGASAQDIRAQESFQLEFPGGRREFKQRTYTNPVQIRRD